MRYESGRVIDQRRPVVDDDDDDQPPPPMTQADWEETLLRRYLEAGTVSGKPTMSDREDHLNFRNYAPSRLDKLVEATIPGVLNELPGANPDVVAARVLQVVDAVGRHVVRRYFGAGGQWNPPVPDVTPTPPGMRG